MKNAAVQKRVFWSGALFVCLAVMISIMVIPISPWLMDLLVTVNFCISITILCLAVFIENPLGFSSFPSVLLMATLFRLSLNISSTRLILTSGNPGLVIQGFGKYVVGGDLVVGGVVFSILVLVLFLVISKGAQRVAEVAARFTLDALPGLQAAIETDLRARAISGRELSLRREALEQRSMFYGALDGAMKFVRGDAIVAIVITLINMGAGTWIGTWRRGLAVGDALSLYGKLAIGDGLVTMMPALLISTGAGILVTRVGETGKGIRLGQRIGGQLAAEPSALIAAAAIAGGLGLVPGLPAWPFVMVAIGLAVGGAALMRAKHTRKTARDNEMRGRDTHAVTVDEMQTLLDDVSRQHPVLVREAVGDRISLALLCELVTEMRKDGIDTPHLCVLLEALAREPVGSDVDDLLIRVRRRMGTIITATVEGKDVAIVDGDYEALLTSYIEHPSTGKQLVLPQDLSDDIRGQLMALTKENRIDGILCNASLRRPLARYLSRFMDAPVVAISELSPDAAVNVVSTISD